MPHPTPYFEGKAYIRDHYRKMYGRELSKEDLFTAARKVYSEVNGVPLETVTNEQAGYAVAHYEDEVLDLVL